MVDMETEHYKEQYRLVWLVRDFNGYFCSVYWWFQAFYPTKKPLMYYPFR